MKSAFLKALILLLVSSMIVQFRDDAKKLIITLLEKLWDKSPIASTVLRCLAIFDPMTMVSLKSKFFLKRRLKSLLTKFMNLKILSPSQCDAVNADFSKLKETELKRFKDTFSSYEQNTERIDDFCFRKINIQHYKSLSFLLQILFIMSHGQAAVERGFSINNNVVEQNMSPETITARRLIKDHMLANGLTPESIHLSQNLIRSVRGAAQKYKDFLEEKRKESEREEEDRRLEVLSNDMIKLKNRCQQMQRAIDEMEVESTECFERAEKENNMSLVIKGNGLKRKAGETKVNLKTLEEEYAKLEDKRKKMST